MLIILLLPPSQNLCQETQQLTNSHQYIMTYVTSFERGTTTQSLLSHISKAFDRIREQGNNWREKKKKKKVGGGGGEQQQQQQKAVGKRRYLAL